jgi:hypothetical protein
MSSSLQSSLILWYRGVVSMLQALRNLCMLDAHREHAKTVSNISHSTRQPIGHTMPGIPCVSQCMYICLCVDAYR